VCSSDLDSSDIPISAFDGLFLPVYVDDIPFIASQVAFSNFQTQLIGNADWYDKELLKRNKQYVNGLIFVTDGYINEEGWDYRQFVNNYRNTFKKTPGKFELIAYDCFMFISGAISKGSTLNRSNFLQKIVQLKPYQGVYRKFDIDGSHSNQSARILKYIYSQILPVK